MHPVAPQQQNGLGLTGFIISLVGLFLCGIPSLIGLVVSTLALKKQPKGLAVAGLILGLLGIIELVAFAFLTYSTYQITKNVGATLQILNVEMQLKSEAIEIGAQWESTGVIPTLDEGTELIGDESDLFGNPIEYETDGASFSLRSAGPDGLSQTEDDIVVGPFDEASDATVLQDEMENEFEFEDMEEFNF